MSRILLVDDELALLELLRRYLERLGHQVTCCASAREGLQALERAEPAFDVAVLDHGLPDISGMDVLPRVLTQHPHTKVLIASGAPVPAELIEAEHARRVAFLQKPFLPKMLAETLEALLKT